jgi:tRNA G18 (ribose-2'-O)-methylase SpoU
MTVTRLDDPGDELLADYRSVTDAELVARRGLFVAEGRLVVRRLLLDSPFVPESVMVTETALGSIADAIAARPVPVYVVPQHVMNGVAGFAIHRGCLAVGRRTPARDWREVAAGARVMVALERVGNADNVGAIFRTAAAFGAGAVLVGPACADPLYRKAIRTSMAAALTVPFAPMDPWPSSLCALRADGTTIVGLTPSPDAVPLGDVASSVRGRRVAIVVGHEGEGLTSGALAACDHRARIPMAPGSDSLNVAVAAAIALYELAGS